MRKREIEIVIGPDGQIRFEVQGVPGKACLDLTRDLEEALGEVVEREYTREYYQQAEPQQQAQKLGTGRG